MPGLVPGIHAFLCSATKTWMAGSSPAMTTRIDRAQVPSVSIGAFADAKVADRVQGARRLGLATSLESLLGGCGFGVQAVDRVPLPRIPSRECPPVLAA